MDVSDIESNPLLNPEPKPPAWLVETNDVLSRYLPFIVAALSIGSGYAAVEGPNGVAAILGIGGGVVGAAATFFTNWSSRTRDRRLEVALAGARLGVDMAGSAQVIAAFAGD